MKEHRTEVQCEEKEAPITIIIQNQDNTEIQGIQKVNLNVLIVGSTVIWLEHAKVNTHTKDHTVETNTVQAKNAAKINHRQEKKRASTPYNKKSSECDEDNNKYTSLNEIRSPLERTAKKTTAVVNEPGKEGNQLFLAGKIESKCTKLFIDCGSGISLISNTFYHQLSKKRLQKSTAKLQTANQQPLHVLGKVRINIRIHGTSRREGKFGTSFEFHVTEGLSRKVFLGMDFLERHNAIIDTKNKKLTIEDYYAAVTVHKLINVNQHSFNVDVASENDFHMPAKSEMLLTGKLTGDVGESRVGLFTQIRKKHQPEQLIL